MKSFGASTHVVVDVQGYFVPDSPTPPRGASKYLPVTPCRIVDTRAAGGALAAGTSRTWQVPGSNGFAAQGGRSDCDIPVGSNAVEAAVTAVGPAGTGFLRAWPADVPAPTATFLNYRGSSITNTGALAVSSIGQLNAKAFSSSTHVVIDVQGAFVPVQPNLERSVAAGGSRSCAIRPDRTLRCWGKTDIVPNDDGLLPTARAFPSPIVGAIQNASVVAGPRHACLTPRVGSVLRCWGSNEFGQLGTSVGAWSSTPFGVGLSQVSMAAVGTNHTCGIENGTVRCLGAGSSGQLGNGTTTPSATPVTVTGITDAMRIAAGGNHTCAIVTADRCGAGATTRRASSATAPPRARPLRSPCRASAAPPPSPPTKPTPAR